MANSSPIGDSLATDLPSTVARASPRLTPAVSAGLPGKTLAMCAPAPGAAAISQRRRRDLPAVDAHDCRVVATAAVGVDDVVAGCEAAQLEGRAADCCPCGRRRHEWLIEPRRHVGRRCEADELAVDAARGPH